MVGAPARPPPVLVVDVGAETCRVGYAGDEVPSVVVPSLIGLSPGGCRGGGEAYGGAPPVKRGRFEEPAEPDAFAGLEARPCLTYSCSGQVEWDIDALEVLLGRSMAAVVGPGRSMALPPRSPVLVSEPNQHCRKLREALAEVLFESLDAPGAYVAKTAALSAFALGRTSALVLDAGAGLSSSAPVFDGQVAMAQLREWPFAGQALDIALLKALREQGVELKPHFGVCPGLPASVPAEAGRGGAAGGRWRHGILRMAQDMKESICFCSHVPLSKSEAAAPFLYTLPDGQEVDVAEFSRSLPEALITGSGGGFRGMPRLLADSINGHRGDVPVVLRDVLLCGGSSLFVNFKARLEAGVAELVPPQFAKRMKVQAARDRRHVAWLGGSALAGAGVLGSGWVTAQEYAECGAGVFEGRCP